VIPLAVTVLNRYDLLRVMLTSIDSGTMRPSRLLVLDNGRSLFDELRGWDSFPLWNVTHCSLPGKDRGVAASWNEAIRWANGGPLVICNDDITFAPDAFEKLVHGMRWGEPDLATTGNVGGFVCFAMTSELVAKIGTFDERFFPAYFEDEDYRYRMKLAGLEPRPIDGCDIRHVESGTLKAMTEEQKEVFKLQFMNNATLYRQKWGGIVGEETLEEPAL